MAFVESDDWLGGRGGGGGGGGGGSTKLVTLSYITTSTIHLFADVIKYYICDAWQSTWNLM